MEEEITAIPANEIIFAVKRDGSIINNLSENGDCQPDRVLGVFEGLNNLAKQATKAEIAALALCHLVSGRDFPKLLVKRMEEEKAKSKEEKGED